MPQLVVVEELEQLVVTRLEVTVFKATLLAHLSIEVVVVE
jgi:hypothetical protein